MTSSWQNGSKASISSHVIWVRKLDWWQKRAKADGTTKMDGDHREENDERLTLPFPILSFNFVVIACLSVVEKIGENRPSNASSGESRYLADPTVSSVDVKINQCHGI
jgi:hypothetical protein